jgi:hypothetical protein
MLSEVLQFSPLSFNSKMQLRRVGGFYISSNFTEEFIGPPIVVIGKTIYYRFMKFIYLPQPPEKLYPDQVIKVCDLRLDYLDKLVDFQFNKRIVSTMVDCGYSPTKR